MSSIDCTAQRESCHADNTFHLNLDTSPEVGESYAQHSTFHTGQKAYKKSNFKSKFMICRKT